MMPGKYALVPSEELDDLRSARAQKSRQENLSHLKTLDEKLRSVLDNNALSSDEKYAVYKRLLQLQANVDTVDPINRITHQPPYNASTRDAETSTHKVAPPQPSRKRPLTPESDTPKKRLGFESPELQADETQDGSRFDVLWSDRDIDALKRRVMPGATAVVDAITENLGEEIDYSNVLKKQGLRIGNRKFGTAKLANAINSLVDAGAYPLNSAHALARFLVKKGEGQLIENNMLRKEYVDAPKWTGRKTRHQQYKSASGSSAFGTPIAQSTPQTGRGLAGDSSSDSEDDDADAQLAGKWKGVSDSDSDRDDEEMAELVKKWKGVDENESGSEDVSDSSESDSESDSDEKSDASWRELLRRVLCQLELPDDSDDPADLLQEPLLLSHLIHPLREKADMLQVLVDKIRKTDFHRKLQVTTSRLGHSEKFDEEEAFDAAWDLKAGLAKSTVITPNLALFQDLVEEKVASDSDDARDSADDATADDASDNADDASDNADDATADDASDNADDASNNDEDAEDASDDADAASDDASDDDDESDVWRVLLAEIATAGKEKLEVVLPTTANLLKPPNFERLIYGPLKKLYTYYIELQQGIENSDVIAKLEETKEKMISEEHYSEDEAAEAAWERRKFLIKNDVLLPNADLLKALYE